MEYFQNSIAVNNPNIKPLSSLDSPSVPTGEFIGSSDDGIEEYNNIESIIKFYDMYLPNFSIRISEGNFLEKTVLINMNKIGVDLLGSCLILRGAVKSFILDNKEPLVENHDGTQNFKFDPNNEIYHLIAPNTPFHCVHISYTKDYLMQYLPDNEYWIELIKNKIDKGETILADKVSIISINQRMALQSILSCPLRGKLGIAMIEASIMQIIIFQLYSLFGVKKEIANKGISSKELEAIQELRIYLSKTFLEDHSLTNLSRYVGMNNNKLMSLFKKVFGISIFEYIDEMKMEHARILLREQSFLVTDIAYTLGYKNPNHFSTAFKKKYGICPSQYKN